MTISPVFAGFSVRAEGNRVVLVKGDAVEPHTYFWRNSSSEWMSIRDIAGWCSIVALSVIAMVDEEYGVTLTGDDIRKAQTVKDVFDAVVARKG